VYKRQVVSSGGSIIWGIAFAVVAAFVADFGARTFYVFGDCHVDPPAMGIAFTSFVIMGVLPLTGIYKMDSTIVPAVIIALAVIYSFIQKPEKAGSSV
jgi:hypothetical protein